MISNAEISACEKREERSNVVKNMHTSGENEIVKHSRERNSRQKELSAFDSSEIDHLAPPPHVSCL